MRGLDNQAFAVVIQALDYAMAGLIWELRVGDSSIDQCSQHFC